jgi:methylmalonyl-CoA mutase
MPESDQQAELFKEFTAATLDDWRQEAERSLKGKPLSRLVRNTPEGFPLEPIYGPDELPPHARVRGAVPGAAPFVRGSTATPGWSICQEVEASDPPTWNQLAREEIEAGADGVVMAVGEGGVALSSAKDLDAALDGLDLGRFELVFQGGDAPAIARLLSGSSVSLGQVRGALSYDPLGASATQIQIPFEEMAELVRWSTGEAPGLSVVACHGEAYHDAGASAVQELAYTLATGAEYLRGLVEAGLDPAQAATRIQLSFAVGSRMLMEVAKLRAARLLWATVTGAFGEPSAAVIQARTSSWSQTVRDPWVNMLRATVQTFAAVVGGAKRVTVAPFDHAVGAPDGFSRRVARNTQIILRDESFLDRVVDPAGGSWALEALTDRLGREAWALFQEVERRGGMRAALEEGFAQGEVRHTADLRRQSVALRTEPFIGVSVFPDPDEKPLPTERREGAKPRRGVGPAGRQPGDMLLPRWRAVEDYERLRDAADAHRERTGELPRVFLASWGDPARLRPRIDWAAGALKAGGFKIEGESVYPSAAEAADAARASGIGLVLACADDDAYDDGLPALRDKLGSTQIVAAGPAPDQPSPGVLYLHRKTDLVSALDELHRALGVIQ